MSELHLDDPGEGSINFSYGQSPRPEVEPVRPVAELPAVRKWGFNEQKLRRVIEQAEQVSVARRDLSDRLRDARMDLQVTRSDIVAADGHPHSATLARLSFEEAEVKRLTAEQQILDGRAEETIRVARRCEQFARDQGWTPDGRTLAPVRGPGVAGS